LIGLQDNYFAQNRHAIATSTTSTSAAVTAMTTKGETETFDRFRFIMP
jgi:hypothetical protein